MSCTKHALPDGRSQITHDHYRLPFVTVVERSSKTRGVIPTPPGRHGCTEFGLLEISPTGQSHGLIGLRSPVLFIKPAYSGTDSSSIIPDPAQQR